MIKAIAFDFGGTLFSTAKMGAFTAPMIHAFVDGLIRSLGCSRSQGEKIFEAYTKAWKSRRERAVDLPQQEVSSLELLRTALREVGAELSNDDAVAVLNAFHARESDGFSPLPMVLESLPLLVGRGYRLAIVSNNPWAESIRASLRRCGMESCFERLIVSCDVGTRKPHRRIFDELLIQLQVAPSDVLFVGDSFIHDIEVPKAMGMRTCLVDFEGMNKNGQSERSKEADLFLTEFDQLLPMLSRFQ